MLPVRNIWLTVLLFPAVRLQLSPDKNLIWTVLVKGTTTKLLEYISGEPPTQHRGNITVQTLSAPFSIRPYSLTFDYQNSSLYLANLNGASFYRINVLSGVTELQITAVHLGFASATQLAMDWSTRNLYWVDTFFSWIAMKSLITTGVFDFKIIVESDVEKPFGLALDPTRGYMFWSERRKTPVIRRAGLDGSDTRAIAVGGIIDPTAMTIDVGTGKIYWVDYIRDTLESCLNDGRERRLVKKKSGPNFKGVAYYENTLFVTDTYAEKVYVIQDETGIEQDPLSTGGEESPQSVIVYAGELQPNLSDPCLNLSCEHFCVRTVSAARCLCQDGYKLSTDGYSCTGSVIYSPRLLVYTNRTNICFVDITSVYRSNISPNCLVSNGVNVNAIASDSNSRVVYYADRGRNKIYALSLRTGESSTIVSNAGQVEGLSFDWLTNTIFWTDSSSNSIRSLGITSKRTTTETVPVTGKLRRLAVDPFSRKIFCVTTNPASIISYDGRDALRIVKYDIHTPVDIHCDPVKERVYWTNFSSIGVVNMDGTGHRKLMSTPDSNNQGLVSSKGFVFWTSQSTGVRLNFGVIANVDENRIQEVDIQGSTELVDIDVLDASAQQTRGVCFDNGGCDHYCIPMSSGRECRCELGYKLQTDGRTCTTELLEDEHILVADLDAKRLYQVDINSGQVFGSFLVNSSLPTVAVDPSSTVLYWSDIYQGKVYSSHLNGSSNKTLFSTGLTYAERLAVDTSTGNIFYSANVVSNRRRQSYIAVASPDGKDHRKIISDLDSPRAIELYSSQGIMFWSDHGFSCHIGRANMDGSQKETIISTEIRQPNGIAIDMEENILYWADGSLNVIERCSFSGTNRQVILEDHEASLLSLLINKDRVYYTAKNRFGIISVKKADGTNKRVLAESPLYGQLSDLIIVRPNSRQTANNACSEQNGGCSTLCLPTKTGKTCACELQSDGITCVEERQTVTTVIIGSVIPGIMVLVSVFVAKAVCLARRRKARRQPDTVVYSVEQVPGISYPIDHDNSGYTH